MKKGNLLRSSKLVKRTTFTLVLLVVVILISSSSFSVKLSNISNTNNSNLEAIEKETSIKVEPSTGLAPNIAIENPNIPVVSFGAIMRGYITNSSVFDEGTCYFDVDDPGSITYLHDTESDNFLSGGTGYEGTWFACEHSNGALWQIDPDNGDMTYIGGGGVGLNGLATDFTTDILYGASGSDLYLVDPDVGSQELIGSFGDGVNEMIAIAADSDGQMYGWDLGDKLWTIDKETGEATEIGPLGIDINYAQDGDFDYEVCILYLTAFTLSPYYGSYLYVCDRETGECTLVGQLEGNSQITASVIDLGGWCSSNDIGVKDIISPKDGYASEDMQVIVQVKNYGNTSENNVKVNAVILKDGIYEEYNETIYIDIDYGETLDVEMPPWTPDDWQSVYNEYIDYKITAHVKLYGDDYHYNDYKEKWFELYFGYFHDVGCTNVIGPESGPAQTFPVNATIKNLGQYDECCFKTYVDIAEIDIENQVELLSQDFSDYEWPPNGWTVTSSKWQLVNSSYAGGSLPEARFQWKPAETGWFRLYTPAIDTSDYSAIEIGFKHFVDHYTTPYTLRVEISQDAISWTTIWSISPSGNVGPETVTILTGDNVGSDTFYVSWTFEGNSYNINYWYVDDIVINGYNLFNPEYQDNHCTTTIESGEEFELEFDNWTPEFLAEETTGTKIYLVKAWTDMINPPDENPDNDLIIKSIILDYFHDISIQVEEPSERGNKLIWDNGDTDGSDGYSLLGNPQRRLLDDFELTQIAKISQSQCFMVAGSPTDFEIHFRKDVNKKPSTTIYATSKDIKTTSKATGRTWFGYPEQLVTYTFEPIKLSKGIWWAEFWTSASSGNMFMMVRSKLWREECWINYADYGFMKGSSYYGTKADLSFQLWGQAGAEVYVAPGDQDIDGLASNIGTFPERDMTCYAEIYEFYSDCENGNLVYEDNITDIDILIPLTGTKILEFTNYNFQVEGLYRLDLEIVDDSDELSYDNNRVEYIIGCDATPPATTHALNPPAPDGLNGWYISDVKVTLISADPSIGCDAEGSGVKEIKYQIDDGAEQILTGGIGTFTVTTDSTMHTIKYWAIDNVGNMESQKTINFKQDKTQPEIEFVYEWSGNKAPYLFTFTANVIDATSLMQRVEIYLNSELQETIIGPGPYYIWQIKWVPPPHAIFKAIAYDFAGLSAFENIIDPRSKNSVSQSINSQNNMRLPLSK